MSFLKSKTIGFLKLVPNLQVKINHCISSYIFRNILDLQVVNTFPKKLLGQPPCTIQDYFSKETSRGIEDKMSEPAKRVKLSANNGSICLPKNSEQRPA